MSTYWPDFFIVGAPKCGTTSLFEYIRQHPQVYMSPMKEPHFFSNDLVDMDSDLVITREQDYLKLFEDASEFKVVGEASPSYLCHEQVPHRIKEKTPESKIIIILRDPIERAYSQYLMETANGLGQQPFYDLLAKEFKHGKKVFGPGHLFVESGQYAGQVQRYMNVFGQERVQVLLLEDLKRRPDELLTRVVEFLALDQELIRYIDISNIANPYRVPRNSFIQWVLRFHSVRQVYRRIIPENVRSYVRNRFKFKIVPKPPLDPRVIEYLKPIYEPEVLELETLLGRPLPELRKIW